MPPFMGPGAGMPPGPPPDFMPRGRGRGRGGFMPGPRPPRQGGPYNPYVWLPPWSRLVWWLVDTGTCKSAALVPC
jgi:hypothetical protein